MGQSPSRPVATGPAQVEVQLIRHGDRTKYVRVGFRSVYTHEQRNHWLVDVLPELTVLVVGDRPGLAVCYRIGRNIDKNDDDPWPGDILANTWRVGNLHVAAAAKWRLEDVQKLVWLQDNCQMQLIFEVTPTIDQETMLSDKEVDHLADLMELLFERPERETRECVAWDDPQACSCDPRWWVWSNPDPDVLSRFLAKIDEMCKKLEFNFRIVHLNKESQSIDHPMPTSSDDLPLVEVRLNRKDKTILDLTVKLKSSSDSGHRVWSNDLLPQLTALIVSHRPGLAVAFSDNSFWNLFVDFHWPDIATKTWKYPINGDTLHIGASSNWQPEDVVKLASMKQFAESTVWFDFTVTVNQANVTLYNDPGKVKQFVDHLKSYSDDEFDGGAFECVGCLKSYKLFWMKPEENTCQRVMNELECLCRDFGFGLKIVTREMVKDYDSIK